MMQFKARADNTRFNANRTVRALLCLTWLFNGCTVSQIEDPYAVMLNRDAEWTARRIAARQAYRDHHDDPALLQTLHQVIWTPGYPAWQRIEAVDMLLELDEQAFREALNLKIMTVPDRETLSYIFDQAVKHKWTDFTPLAVRSYARRDPMVDDLIRPERRVIRLLNPGRTAEDVIFDIFINEQEHSVSSQSAAWDLLCRLTDRKRVLQLMEQAPTTMLVSRLRAAQQELGVVPRNREELLWLLAWSDPKTADWRRRATELVKQLTPQQRQGLEMRHLPVLLRLDSARLHRARSVWLAEAAVHLGRSEHHFKQPSDESVQKLAANATRLCWADLAVIGSLIDVMQSRELVNDFFEQADEDHQDKTTEHGGAILHDHATAGMISQRYKPLLKKGDDVFIPPHIMVEQLYTGLFHYHFHVQYYKNGPHAGPGGGDRQLASNLPFNFFVVTAIDQNHLNVDYYQPNGVVIDMGTLVRPAN